MENLIFVLSIFCSVHSTCLCQQCINIPLAYCLLKDRKEEIYKNLLIILKVESLNLGYLFQPKKVVVDFKKAIHMAVRKSFAGVILIGCRFHLSQAWWRKIQSLGLTRKYKDDVNEVRKRMYYVFGLTFLCPEQVGDAFVELMEEQPIDKRLSPFSDFVVDKYVDEDSCFPPNIWAAPKYCAWRTTNGCESFHSKFNAACPSPHPNINVFLKCIYNVQIDTYVKITSINKRIIKKTDTIIFKKIIQYTNNEIHRLRAGCTNVN